MKTTLVTGGAGYVGAHTCKALAHAGYRPVIFDNLSQGHRSAVRWGPLVVGDILDRNQIDKCIERHQPDAVIHFAASAYVGESVKDPGKYYRNNVVGSLVLLEAMRDAGIQKIVFSSSCATYGIPGTIPIEESTPQLPVNPYGQSKLVVERMIRDFGHAHAISGIALRYFNAAGADPEGDIGENHDPETHLVPLALDALSGLGPPLTIFGSDYETPDGTCIRDYIHVSDLADAHVKALQVLENGSSSDACNLGTGRGYSIKEVLATIHRVTGEAVPAKYGARREGDPPALVAATDKAREFLDWQPCHSDLEEIIRTAWSWYQKSKLERIAK